MGDLSYAFRTFLRSPGFPILAVGLIALAIAFNTALFSLLHASLLAPLPYPSSERLVTVVEVENGRDTPVLSPANFADLRRDAATLEDATGYRYEALELSGIDPPERVTALFVLPGFFDFAGVPPLAGRSFTEADHTAATARTDTLWSLGDVAVLDHEFWLRRFGGAPEAVGTTMRLNDKAVLIIGVMPQGFDALWRETDVYVPWILPPDFWEARPPHILPMAARLVPGATLEEADAEVRTLYARLADAYPETNAVLEARVVSLRAFLFGDAGEAVLVLQAGALLVLVIACANLTGLLLTRARKRSLELAVRLALGASRARIRSQLLAESSLLAVAGGALGLALAHLALGAASLPVSLELPFEPRLSPGVLAGSFVLLAGTALFLGLVPAYLAGRESLSTTLRGRPFDASARGMGLAFSTVQVTLAVGLASAAAAFLSSLDALQSQELGFDPTSTATLAVTLPDTRYEDEASQRSFRRRALDELRSLPGVVSVDTASHLPLTPIRLNLAVALADRPLPRGTLRAAPVFASEGLIRTLGGTFLEGRSFQPSDTQHTPWVVIANERMAREFWPGEGAVGKRFRLDYPWAPSGHLTVVGVVADMKQEGLVQDVRPSFFILHEQFPQEWFYFAVRTTGPAEEVMKAARARLAAIDPNLPVTDLRTMEDRLSASLGEFRSRTRLAGVYAGAAVFLAALGLYASLSSHVSHRRREIGIRLALGAGPGDVARWAVRHGVQPLLFGIPLGLAVTWISARFLASLMFRVSPLDPATLAGAISFVTLVGLLAASLPAYRASRVSPADRARVE